MIEMGAFVKKIKLFITVGLLVYFFNPIHSDNHTALGKKVTSKGAELAIVGGIVGFAGLISAVDFLKPEIGYTLLHKAVNNNDIEQVRFLLNKGLNINLTDIWSGETPLHVAVKKNNSAMVKFLFEVGANPNVKNKKMTPLVLFNNPKEITETPLHYAARNNNLEIAKILLDNGAAIDMQNENGNTALHLAVLENNPEMVNFLLSSGADQYVRNMPGFVGLYGDTPLDLAYKSLNTNPEIIKSLTKDSWFSWLW